MYFEWYTTLWVFKVLLLPKHEGAIYIVYDWTTIARDIRENLGKWKIKYLPNFVGS